MCSWLFPRVIKWSELDPWGHRAETHLYSCHILKMSPPNMFTRGGWQQGSSTVMGFEGNQRQSFRAFLSWENDIIPPSLPKTSHCWDGLWIVTAFQANKKALRKWDFTFFSSEWEASWLWIWSLDGGKLALSYKGFFLFLKNLKKKNPRERHMRVFSYI